MQLNEKELETLKIHPDTGIFYFNFETCGLCSSDTIRAREKAKDLNEFKRFVLGVETDEEVEDLRYAFRKYCRLAGYLKTFEIKNED